MTEEPIMKKGKSKRLDNILIFDRNNPNFNIKETNEEIVEMFRNKDVRVINDDKKQMIGIVVGVREWHGSKLYGDVYFWSGADITYMFDNYGIEIDGDRIVRVAYIEFSRKDR